MGKERKRRRARASKQEMERLYPRELGETKERRMEVVDGVFIFGRSSVNHNIDWLWVEPEERGVEPRG